MIWRNPGFPSLLVTYGTASDLFFSGHTAIAVYGALELAHWGGPAWAAVGLDDRDRRSGGGDRPARPLHDGRLRRSDHRSLGLDGGRRARADRRPLAGRVARLRSGGYFFAFVGSSFGFTYVSLNGPTPWTWTSVSPLNHA